MSTLKEDLDTVLDEHLAAEMSENLPRMPRANSIFASHADPGNQRFASDELISFPHASGYEPLAEVLVLAFRQSAFGKGQERHGHGKPFLRQPIMELGRMTGIAAHTYQVGKKAQEATTMARVGQIDAAKAELLGAIVYAAAGYLLLNGQ